jgi:Mg/Co/Ni transporter MgtE
MSDSLALAAAMAEAHPEDAARALDDEPVEESTALLVALEADIAAAVLAQMTPSRAAACLAAMDAGPTAARLALMTPRDAAAYLRIADAARRDALIAALPRTRQLQIGLVLRQPVQTVGAWMDSAAPSIRVDSTVVGVRENLPRDAAIPDRLYVIDVERRYAGCVPVSAVLAAAGETRIDELYMPGGHVLRANLGVEAALADAGWVDEDELPVVDQKGQFVGAIRYATLRRATARMNQEKPQPGDDGISDAMKLADQCYLGLARAMDVAIARRRSADPHDREQGT